MALLDEKTREKYLKELGYGSIKDVQRAVMYPQWVDGVYGSQTDNALRTAYYVHKNCKDFDPKEFRCECGGKYCGGYPDYMKPAELKHIQTIRDHYGKPITITSGLRCKEWNRVLNGSVENSGHLRGLALDFWLPGVTDTVANRKAAMRYFMSLPNHKFTYGAYMNGSDGIYRSASYMGNAMHTECYNTNAQPGKLNVDGIGGGQTVMAIQKHFGLKVIDGIISGQSKDLGKYYTSLIAVEYGVGGSATVKALQKWAGCSQDGVWGKGTSEAMQKKLNSLGYSVGSYGADGYFSADSMKAMQRFLNGDKPGPVPPTPTDYYRMIDVSEFQPSIDWSKVKADGVKGVIIRCGGRGGGSGKIYEDSKFMEYIKGAHKAGLPVGIYFLTQAITAAEGKAEAQYAIKLWTKAGVPISYPICIDSENVTWKNEDGSTGYGRANDRNLSTAKRTAAIKGFCDEIKKQGYKAMIYASTGWLNNQVDMSKLDCDVWVAQYYSQCQYKGKYVIWQYTSEGSVSGVKGVVDMNRCYIKPKKVEPPKSSKKHYTGPYPSIHVKRDASHVIGNAVNFGRWIAGDNDFHYGFGDHAHHNGCYFCGTNGAKKGHMKMWEHTYCCNPFVHACFAHGGLVPSMLKMCQQGLSYGFKQGEGYDASNLFKKINRADAKAGDVFCSDCHVALYIGNGKIVHAGSEDDNVIHSDSWNRSITIGEWKDKYYDPPRVYRFIGSVDADIVMRKGEVSGRVKDLQNYLIWFGTLPKSEKADGYFSDKVFDAVVEMQKALGVAPDGIVENATLKAMKAYKK